jgi:hypothetical protein
MSMADRPSRRLPSASRRDAAEALRRLRYMDPANIARDFPSKRERAAIAAVLRWLSLNSTVAWRLKNGTYTKRARNLFALLAPVLAVKKRTR